MTVPRCAAPCCAGVADDGKGLCAAHRRALTLSSKLQDAVGEYVNAGNRLDAIKPTDDNAHIVGEAGEHLAQGLALLISTRLHDVTFDPSPLRRGTHTPWRVSFAWRGNFLTEAIEDESDDDEQLEVDEP